MRRTGGGPWPDITDFTSRTASDRPICAPVFDRAFAENRPVYISNVPSSGGGLSERAGSGIYTVMPARGSVIGMLAIEHTDLEHFTARDLELIEGFVAPASLAVDNARWFARLRTVGADEERTRIARDLHDRIGQSLAYLAFELDRIVERDSVGDPITDEIGQLRSDVRGVIREVRDTLYDLRTDVSESMGLGEVLDQFVDRVTERSGLQIQVDADTHARLPLLQEREMWRVAQEALANVERHADATAVRVVWRCDGQRALIDVTDNGKGFDARPCRPSRFLRCARNARTRREHRRHLRDPQCTRTWNPGPVRARSERSDQGTHR